MSKKIEAYAVFSPSRQRKEVQVFVDGQFYSQTDRGSWEQNVQIMKTNFHRVLTDEESDFMLDILTAVRAADQTNTGSLPVTMERNTNG